MFKANINWLLTLSPSASLLITFLIAQHLLKHMRSIPQERPTRPHPPTCHMYPETILSLPHPHLHTCRFSQLEYRFFCFEPNHVHFSFQFCFIMPQSCRPQGQAHSRYLKSFMLVSFSTNQHARLLYQIWHGRWKRRRKSSLGPGPESLSSTSSQLCHPGHTTPSWGFLIFSSLAQKMVQSIKISEFFPKDHRGLCGYVY